MLLAIFVFDSIVILPVGMIAVIRGLLYEILAGPYYRQCRTSHADASPCMTENLPIPLRGACIPLTYIV